MESLEQKYGKLLERIARHKKAAVAFSGGTDSSFLCHAAVQALGADNAAAITVVSPMLPQSELACARSIAALTGIRHILVEEKHIEDAVAANSKERCYHCKKIEFGAILEAAREQGISAVLDGSNIDDEDDYRPGLRALAELNIASPLREAGLNKADVRELSRKLNLPTWNKPAAACLASRFPYGERIDAQKLRRVEAAEAYLRSLGFTQLRVRSHGGIARIEVAPPERRLFFNETLLDAVSRKFKSLGFTYAALELEGYTMGSMNAALQETPLGHAD